MKTSMAALLLSAPLLALNDDEVPLRGWTAPPFWTPAEQPAPEGGERPEAMAAAALPSAAVPFVAVAPCRLVDTRGGPAVFAGGGPIAPGGGNARSYALAGACGTAAGAVALSLNLTVVNAQGPGFLQAFPQGGSTSTSAINYEPGQVIANGAIVPVNTANGQVTFLAGVSGTDLVVDVNGYYAPVSLVNSVNALSGNVTLTPGANVTITPSGNALTIASAANGTITGVTAGPGLSGGGTSGNVGLAVASPVSLIDDRLDAVIRAQNNGSGSGVQGYSASWAGVSGIGGASGTTYGVHGYTNSSSGHGVYGFGPIAMKGVSLNPSIFSYAYVGSAGVWGDSSQGVGVYGTSTDNVGVVGTSHQFRGVMGTSTYGTGVYASSSNGYAIWCNGSGVYTGSWSASSDARLKRDVAPLDRALARVLALRGVTYRWRAEEFPDRAFPKGAQVGLLAQEVEPVVPEVVTTDAEGYRAVDYAKLVPLLVEAIKEQQRQLERLREEVENLEELRGGR